MKPTISITHKELEDQTTIRFAYHKTILHYLKRFIKAAKWNAEEKVWIIPAADPGIDLELFKKACCEWCDIIEK